MGLGYGIGDPGKTYPGSETRGQKGTVPRIRIRHTATPEVTLFFCLGLRAAKLAGRPTELRQPGNHVFSWQHGLLSGFA